MRDGAYNWEEDDIAWEDDTRVLCANCLTKYSMPGQKFCVYCDRVIVPGLAHTGVLGLERLLAKYAPFSEWCVAHHAI